MDFEKCCGCVIFDNDKVLMLQQNAGFWGFPKGHMEAGETEKQTAIRETKEETNIDVEVDISKRYEIEYTTDTGINKKVVYFTARQIGGSVERQPSEVKDIRWVSFDEAFSLMEFDNIKDLFKKVLNDMK